MHPPRRYLLAILALVALAGCSSTKVVTQWQAPEVTRLQFKKILALALAPETSLRHVAEEELCLQVAPVECKPAYFVVPEAMMQQKDAAKALVQRAGFDGAVVFRVVSAKENVTYVPPTYGPTFWGYYGYAAPMMAQPGYYRSDQVVRVETSIYSLSEDRLLWVATTESMNPKSVADLVEEVAAAVRKELQRQGLVPEKP